MDIDGKPQPWTLGKDYVLTYSFSKGKITTGMRGNRWVLKDTFRVLGLDNDHHLVRWVPVELESVQPGYYKSIAREKRFRRTLEKGVFN